jgi:hypothetical protein
MEDSEQDSIERTKILCEEIEGLLYKNNLSEQETLAALSSCFLARCSECEMDADAVNRSLQGLSDCYRKIYGVKFKN